MSAFLPCTCLHTRQQLPVLSPTSTSSSSAQPFQSSTLICPPSTHMTTPTHLEGTNHYKYIASKMVTLRPLLTETDSPSKSTTVRITGPPIKDAKPVLSAFEVMSCDNCC